VLKTAFAFSHCAFATLRLCVESFLWQRQQLQTSKVQR
jgi:hypothetical protein